MGPKELNNHAVNQFNKGQLNTALEAFTQAFRVMPRNQSIALNLLQCLFDSTKQSGSSFNMDLARRCYALLDKAKLQADQTQRLDKILHIAKEMNLDIQSASK